MAFRCKPPHLLCLLIFKTVPKKEDPIALGAF